MEEYEVHDMAGRTLAKGVKFYTPGFRGVLKYHGIVLNVIDPDEGTGVKLRVEFNDGEIDYLPCSRRDSGSDIFICDEILVEI